MRPLFRIQLVEFLAQAQRNECVLFHCAAGMDRTGVISLLLLGLCGVVHAEAKTYKVGVSIYQYTDNFMTLYRNEIEAYFKTLETDEVKYEIIMADGKNDMAEQTNQVQNFITQGVDVIILNLVQTSSADAVIDMIVAAEIPLVLINREPLAYDADGNTIDEAYEGILDNAKVCYVGADARQSGTFQGKMVADLENHGDLNSDGNLTLDDVTVILKKIAKLM